MIMYWRFTGKLAPLTIMGPPPPPTHTLLLKCPPTAAADSTASHALLPK